MTAKISLTPTFICTIREAILALPDRIFRLPPKPSIQRNALLQFVQTIDKSIAEGKYTPAIQQLKALEKVIMKLVKGDPVKKGEASREDVIRIISSMLKTLQQLK